MEEEKEKRRFEEKSEREKRRIEEELGKRQTRLAEIAREKAGKN